MASFQRSPLKSIVVFLARRILLQTISIADVHKLIPFTPRSDYQPRKVSLQFMCIASTDNSSSSESGFIESFVRRLPRTVLDTLLCDRTTGRNIVWADDEYAELGDGYAGEDELAVELITGPRSGVIKPRVAKEQERQSLRTKSRAEVFTPSWLCNLMNNRLDEEWFRRPGTFNLETEGGWEPNPEPVQFPKTKGRGWHSYVTSPRFEITCGEAPFLCSRYDASNGAPIPLGARVGILDRKLRVVSERAVKREAWIKWAFAALRATYGYEYQGDNLLIARINVLETFVEHHRERWGCDPTGSEIDQAAWIVSWNLWQMNGLTCAPPTKDDEAIPQSMLPGFEEPSLLPVQMSLFDAFGPDGPEQGSEPQSMLPFCIIYDWDNDEPVEFAALKSEVGTTMKKFYSVIGNPPYQEEVEGNQRKSPIYNYFMDEAFKVADKVELITPARFLFNAGQTPKEWNRRMLSDSHFKVLWYEPDGSRVFSGPEIKGGVAVTYRDERSNFGPIGTFVAYDEMKGVISKVSSLGEPPLEKQVTGAVPYRFSDRVRTDYPELVSTIGSSFDLRTNILDKLNGKLFFRDKPDGVDCVAIFGLVGRSRDYLWIDRSLIEVPENFTGYKVLLPKASGSGDYGEKLGEMDVASKNVGHTQSFVSIGNFDTEQEADALCSYLKTKFARSLLGILKVTQDVTPRVWGLVPVQDFTPNSDIDWSKPIPEIDRRLYEKYHLSDDEVEFIESHVKEMS